MRFAQDNHMVNALLELRRAPRIADRASEQLAARKAMTPTPSGFQEVITRAQVGATQSPDIGLAPVFTYASPDSLLTASS